MKDSRVGVLGIRAVKAVWVESSSFDNLLDCFFDGTTSEKPREANFQSDKRSSNLLSHFAVRGWYRTFYEGSLLNRHFLNLYTIILS